MNHHWLKKESERWASLGIIDESQRVRIRALYPESHHNHWIIAFGVIGVMLCLGGIALLIAGNWQHIPPFAKFVGLLLLMVASGIFAIECGHRNKPSVCIEGGWLLSSVFPLLGFVLISQIFHLEGKTTDLLLVWTAMILPSVFVSRSISAFVVALIAVTFMVGFGVEDWFSPPRQNSNTFCALYVGWGCCCLVLSILFWRVNAATHRIISEFWGWITVLLAIYIWGLTRSHGWQWLWFGEFLLCLALVYSGYFRGLRYPVNLGFVFVALLFISFFVRLVGTMMQTGFLFLSAGIALLVFVAILEWLRRRLLRGMSIHANESSAS